MAKHWILLGTFWVGAFATFIFLAFRVEGFVKKRYAYEEAHASIRQVEMLKTRGEQIEKLVLGLKYPCQVPKVCALQVHEKIRELCEPLGLTETGMSEKNPASPGLVQESLTMEAMLAGELIRVAALLAMMEEKIPGLVVEKIVTQPQERGPHGRLMHTVTFQVHLGK